MTYLIIVDFVVYYLFLRSIFITEEIFDFKKNCFIYLYMWPLFLIGQKRPPISNKTMVSDIPISWGGVGVRLAETQVPRIESS